jgi:amino acid transporter
LIIPIIIALINIGSTEALGILLSMYNSALLASYTITIGCVLLHRLQGRKLPQARYSLGKWGVLVNIVALIYVTPIFVFSFFPGAPNPTPASMNWAIAMVGGVTLLATIYYIAWGRNTYTPPMETIEVYLERYGTRSEKDVSERAVEVGVETEKRDI